MALARRAAILGVIALIAIAVAAARDTDADPDGHAAGASTGLLFNGTNKNAWQDQSATKTRVRKVWNPDGGPGSALRFQAFNADVFPLTPTANPRAQLVTPLRVRVGGQFWESYEVYLPANFPVAATRDGWVALGSPAYGPPEYGTPPVSLSIEDGNFRFQRDGYAAQPWQIAWQAPLIVGQWVRFTWHVKLSQHGFVQLWMNDQPIELANPGTGTSSTTLNMPVIDPGNARGPWFSQLSVYMKHNSFRSVTAYFRGFRIATTQALAEAG